MRTFIIQREELFLNYQRGKRIRESKVINVVIELSAVPVRYCPDCGEKALYHCNEQHAVDLHYYYQVCIDCSMIFHSVSCGESSQFKTDMINEIKKALNL